MALSTTNLAGLHQRCLPMAMPRCTVDATSRHVGLSIKADAQQKVATQAPTDVSQSSTWISQEARASMFKQGVEQNEPVVAHVTGDIPKWLSGDMIANGGGWYDGMLHMFDGIAMLSKLSIRDGKVTGSQKYIQTQQYKHMRKTGKMRWREFATPLPEDGPFSKVAVVAETVAALATNSQGTTDNASVNVIPLADGTLMAASEAIFATYKVDRDLNTLSQISLSSDKVPGQLLTAHPKLLPDGKTLVNFARTIPGGGFHVFKQDTATLKRTEVAFVRDANPLRPSWVHDFSVTQNYAIILETPLLFNMPSLVLGDKTEYLFMDWVPEQKTYVHVVKLDGSKEVVTHTAPPFFTFHHANAYEEAGCLHVDFCGYEGPQIVNDLCLDSCNTFPGQNVSDSFLWRFTIPLNAPSGTDLGMPRSILPDPAQYGRFAEFPAVNPHYRMKPYRYAYTLSACRPTNMGNAVAKHDLQAGTTQMWHEPGSAPGEPVFVPSPGAQSEDDGVVCCMVMGADGYSFLLVLDAKNWTELGRAKLPYAIPYRFHGTFLPA